MAKGTRATRRALIESLVVASAEVDTANPTVADVCLNWLAPFDQVGAYAAVATSNSDGTSVTISTPGVYIAEVMLLQNGGTTIVGGISFGPPGILFASAVTFGGFVQLATGPNTLPAGITSLGLYSKLTFRIRDRDLAGGITQRNVLRFLCSDGGNGGGAPNLSAQSWFRLHRVCDTGE